MADDLARLMPKPRKTGDIAVGTPDADAQLVQRGTAKALKDVDNPSLEDIEADFAFMNDILAKAGIADTPAATRTAPTERSTASAKASVPSVPRHVPHHKRGSADQSRPTFAVQNEPRTAADRNSAAQPTQNKLAFVAERDAHGPADVYTSIVAQPDDEQLALPFDAPAPAPATAPSPLAAEVAEPEAPKPTAEVARDMVAGMQKADPVTPVICFDIEPVSSRQEIAPVRPSLFARKSKAAARDVSPVRSVPASADDMDPAVSQPPALMRRLMSVIPSTEMAQGMSDFARARMSRDPLDRLLDDAYHA